MKESSGAFSQAARYERVNASFEHAVIQLRQNLEYLASAGKVSAKYISIQNRILEAIINYQHHTEEIISFYEWENFGLRKGASDKVQELLHLIECFEAICVIHGIMDFPIWMKRGRASLVSEAVAYVKEGHLSLPSKFREWLEALPEHEQQQVNRVLYKGFYEELESFQKLVQNRKKQQENDLTTQAYTS